jgi:hypothetical protein
MSREAFDTRREPARLTETVEGTPSRRPAAHARPPVTPPDPPRESTRSKLVAMLSSPAGVRHAMLLVESLGPPRALQAPPDGGLMNGDRP